MAAQAASLHVTVGSDADVQLVADVFLADAGTLDPPALVFESAGRTFSLDFEVVRRDGRNCVLSAAWTTAGETAAPMLAAGSCRGAAFSRDGLTATAQVSGRKRVASVPAPAKTASR